MTAEEKSPGIREGSALRVLFDSEDIGTVVVSKVTARKVLGKFVPNENFERSKNLFEKAIHWSAVIEGIVSDPEDRTLDYSAALWMECITNITGRIEIKELVERIEEFAIFHDSNVEITLADS